MGERRPARQVELVLLVGELHTVVDVAAEAHGDLPLLVHIEHDLGGPVVAPPVRAVGQHAFDDDVDRVVLSALVLVDALAAEHRRDDELLLQQNRRGRGDLSGFTTC
jgi:hypothetical protein